MTEAHSSPERLTPGQEFVQIIDGHFDAIGGVGEPDHRFGEERIELLASSFKAGFGIAVPKVIYANRTIPGYEDLVELGWPNFHGHHIHSSIYSRGFAESLTFFERENEIWVKWILQQYRPQHVEWDESRMAPDLVDNFLTWLRNCTPFLPNPIADL